MRRNLFREFFRYLAALLLAPAIDKETEKEWPRVKKAAAKIKARPMPADIRQELEKIDDELATLVEKEALLHRQIGLDRFLATVQERLQIDDDAYAKKLGIKNSEQLQMLKKEGQQAIGKEYDETSISIIRKFKLTCAQYLRLVAQVLESPASPGLRIQPLVGFGVKTDAPKRGIPKSQLAALKELEKRLNEKMNR
ncbi:MAG: hypothetical protein GX444_06460 [Myxococcales bacterium]|nr:hypothetical protein [Myxococcales bacterium]